MVPGWKDRLAWPGTSRAGSEKGCSAASTTPPHTRDWPAVTAYFSTGRLVGVAVDASRGPQVLLDGIPLVGRAPSRLAADLTAYTDDRDVFLQYTIRGDLASEELGLFGGSQRAEDVLLTRPVLVGTFWADRRGTVVVRNGEGAVPARLPSTGSRPREFPRAGAGAGVGR